MNTGIAYYDTWNKIDIDMADPRKISPARWQQIIISFCYLITRHFEAQNMELFTWKVSDI